MSEATLKKLVGALVVASAVWLIMAIFSRGSGSISAGAEVSSFFEGTGGTAIGAVRMAGPRGTVELRREGDAWTANGFPAAEETVVRLLAEVELATVGDLVASNPANHDRMGVSPDSAITLEISVDGTPRTLLVGKSGRRFGTAYVRLPEDDDVYLLEADLRLQIDRDVDAWRSRVMASVDSSDVVRIEVDRAGDGYVLLRGDSLWTLEGGGEVAQTAVTGVLAELSNLVASGFVADGDSLGALEREATTRAFSDAGEVLAEITLGSGSGERWARTDRDDYVYRVSAFRADRVAPGRQSLQPDS